MIHCEQKTWPNQKWGLLEFQASVSDNKPLPQGRQTGILSSSRQMRQEAMVGTKRKKENDLKFQSRLGGLQNWAAVATSPFMCSVRAVK